MQPTLQVCTRLHTCSLAHMPVCTHACTHRHAHVHRMGTWPAQMTTTMTGFQKVLDDMQTKFQQMEEVMWVWYVLTYMENIGKLENWNNVIGVLDLLEYSSILSRYLYCWEANLQQVFLRGYLCVCLYLIYFVY